MIRVENLVFDYPAVRALDQVSFHVPRGAITALVGPNGAGKTTLLRCLAALEAPLEGSVAIDGLDIQESPRECHRRVGYLSDFFGLYPDLSVRQCLMYVALSHRIDPHRAAIAAAETAALVGLADKLDIRARELSRGQRQRVAIGQAIIHGPSVVLLDEPASGLDPEARHALASLFLRLRDQGMTLFVSSHILAELEEYSSTMLVLRGGRIVEHARLHGAGPQQTRLRARFAAPLPEEGAWRQIAGLERAVRQGNDLLVEFAGDGLAQHELLKRMLAAGLPLCGFAEDRVNLQDAYLATVNGEPAR